MVWFLILVALGLIGFLVEMWLSYQKQADELLKQQEAARRQIEEHHQAIEKLEKRSGEVRTHLVELGSEQDDLKEKLVKFQSELAELEEQRNGHGSTRQSVQLDEL
jgi:septal ring factor EnvC (AmiA/AmiB activator)